MNASLHTPTASFMPARNRGGLEKRWRPCGANPPDLAAPLNKTPRVGRLYAKTHHLRSFRARVRPPPWVALTAPVRPEEDALYGRDSWVPCRALFLGRLARRARSAVWQQRAAAPPLEELTTPVLMGHTESGGRRLRPSRSLARSGRRKPFACSFSCRTRPEVGQTHGLAVLLCFPLVTRIGPRSGSMDSVRPLR